LTSPDFDRPRWRIFSRHSAVAENDSMFQLIRLAAALTPKPRKEATVYYK